MPEPTWRKFVQHLGVESAKTMTKVGFDMTDILTSAGGVSIAEYALGKMVQRATGRQQVRLRTNLGVVIATARVKKVRGLPSIDMRSLRDIKIVKPSPLYTQLSRDVKQRQDQAKLEIAARKRQAQHLREIQERLRRMHRV